MSKNIYKETRNSLGLSREEVSDISQETQFGPISCERLERIENDKFPIHPEEVMLLSKIYKTPSLCNHYCANECKIGKSYVPEIQVKDLEKIVLNMVASLNSMKKNQERLIEISANGTIENNELKDFISIQKELEKISVSVEALQLWTEQMLANGSINQEQYNSIKNQ